MAEGLAQWGQELFMTRERERRRGLAPERDAATEIVQRGFEPCLLALLRLSVATDAGTALTTDRLSTALARTGHLVRAAELAYTISDDLKQGTELVELVKDAAGAGDLRGAQALAESIPLREPRDEALVALVPLWAGAGARDRAAAVAEGIRYPHNWVRVWALLAKAVADTGDSHQAAGFLARADDEVRAFVFDGTGQVLALLTEVATATGDLARAADLADRVEDFTRSRHRTAWSRSSPLATVLAGEALKGDLDRVDALLRPPRRSSVDAGDTQCGWVLGEATDQDRTPAGDLHDADVRLPAPRPFLNAWELACVLDAVAESADGNVELALALADRAETLLDTGDGPDHDTLLTAMTLLLARHGHIERAMALADRLDPDPRAGRQAEIVEKVVRYGDMAGAETLARSIADPRAQARALIAVVRGLARRGDLGRAEALVRVINDRWAQGEALVAVVRETARHGDPGRAESLAHSIAYRATRARALTALVELAKQPSHARTLAAQAVVLDGGSAVLPVLEPIVPRSVAVVVDQLMIRDGL